MGVVDAYVLLMKSLLELPARCADVDTDAEGENRDVLVKVTFVSAATAIKGTRLDKRLLVGGTPLADSRQGFDDQQQPGRGKCSSWLGSGHTLGSCIGQQGR